MDLTQRGILLLLKSAITQQPQELPEGFDMEAAYPLIRQHHMAALCYDGAVRCGVPRQHPVMQEMFRSYCKMLAVSEGQMRQISRIYAAFDANGIDYMPLKGCNMKALYPKPELRTMGDADILIRVEQYDQIVPVMEGLGFVEAREGEHEYVWKSSQLYLELHKRLMPESVKDYDAYFGVGWEAAKRILGHRYAMTVEDTYIFLFVHFAKHYRAGGIGCRHLVDLWIYCRENPDMDEAYVQAEMEKLQLLAFYQNTKRLIAMWFEDAQGDERTAFMTTYVFESGSFGSSENMILSHAVRDYAHTGQRSRLAYLFSSVFPPVKHAQKRYPLLKKAPWLLPAVWIIRLFRAAFMERKSVRKTVRELKILKQDRVDARQEMLRYVGLDYNF